MRRIEGLPESVSIESLTLRDDAYAVLCLPCGGGGEPAAVETCRGTDAKAAAWTLAIEHEATHARRRDALVHAERRRLQAGALGWSQAQADAMVWAAMGWLHYDGKRYLRRDLDNPHVKSGRTVARARVQALVDAGFLKIYEADWSLMLTRDGRAALDAWRAVGPEPAAQESHHLAPLTGGEEEARRDAERAERLAAARAERAEHERHFGEAAPEPAADPEACDHQRHAWLYVTADPITERLGYHLACACGRERDAYPGNSPGMNTGTASRPLGIREADTQVADFHADRRGYHVTGRWTVLDEHTKRAPVEAAAAPQWPAVDDPNRRPAPVSVTATPVTPTADADQETDAPTVTDPTVTETPAAAAVDEAGQDDAHAAWIDRQAERTGLLMIDGPGLVGPGTHVTYRDGHGPGMRSKHGNHGTIVRITTTSVAWRPYGSRRTLRTPLDDMRVTVPRTSTVAEPDDHRTAGWRRWSLAQHLAHARQPTTPAPAPVTAAQDAPQAPADSSVRPAPAGAVQLPLWPAPVATRPTTDRPAPANPLASVTALPVTHSAAAAGPVVVIPCSGAKLDRPAPAGEFYRGSLHTLCRRAADALTADGGTVLVLSARNGLVTLDQVLTPYDLRMGEPGSITAAELRDQAARLGIEDAQDVTVLAAAAYTAAARSVWPHATAPLEGSRGIGEMRHRLSQLARTATRRTA
ncbi:DUF6884 domain-containing protein [Streptomyces sp. NPDC001492]